MMLLTHAGHGRWRLRAGVLVVVGPVIALKLVAHRHMPQADFLLRLETGAEPRAASSS